MTAGGLLCLLYLHAACGVRIQSVEVPEEVRSGEDVTLRCLVVPWPGPLYSLAWWKDGAQFYRAAVTTSPATPNTSGGSHASLFPLPGVAVKGGGGGLGHVVLQGVGVAASGAYSCEAVADFPSFSQHLVTANLTVVDPPDTRPIVAGYQRRYHPGEILSANCTVLRAHPTPIISWLINDDQVKDGVREVLEVTVEADLTTTITVRLRLRLRREHFIDNALNLTCRARVGHSLWTSTTITTHRGHPHKHHHAHQDPGRSGVGVEGLAYDDPSYPYPSVHEGGTASSTAPDCMLAALLPLLVAAGTLGSLLLPREAAGHPRDLPQEAAGHPRDLPQEAAGHTKDVPREAAGHPRNLPQEAAGHPRDLPQEAAGHTKDVPHNDEKSGDKRENGSLPWTLRRQVATEGVIE